MNNYIFTCIIQYIKIIEFCLDKISSFVWHPFSFDLFISSLKPFCIFGSFSFKARNCQTIQIYVGEVSFYVTKYQLSWVSFIYNKIVTDMTRSCQQKYIYMTKLMVEVNRTTSTPNSVLRYDVDKGLNFVLEFNIYPSLTSQIIIPKEKTQFLP